MFRQVGLQISYLTPNFLFRFFRTRVFPDRYFESFRNLKNYISDVVSEHLGQAKIKIFQGFHPWSLLGGLTGPKNSQLSWDHHLRSSSGVYDERTISLV